MNRFKELQQSFLKHLSSLFKMGANKDDKEIETMLIQQGRNEDEKKTISDICKEVDVEHELMEELTKSGLESGEWLEREIEKTTKELYPNATPEEIEMVKQKIEDGMEEEIEAEADRLEEEIEAAQIQPEDNVTLNERKEDCYE